MREGQPILSMENDAIKDLATQLAAIEEESTTLSEQALLDQERHHTETVEQLRQSVNQIIEDNESIFNPSNPSVQAVDPRCIAGKISELSTLTDQLKTTHLEQETVDNFLRYTISSTSVLLLDSDHDEKYQTLQNSVNNLRDELIVGLDVEIDQLKSDISHAGHSIADQREALNELCLDTGNLVDECMLLLEELEDITRTRETEREQGTTKSDDNQPIEEVYGNWQTFKEQLRNKAHLQKHLTHLTQTKNSLKTILEGRESQNPENTEHAETFESYDSLINFWRARFLDRNIENLEVFPRSNKFQFTFSGVEIVMILGGSGISVVELYGNAIPFDQIAAAREEVNREVRSGKPLYASFNSVLDKVKAFTSGI